MIDWDVPSLIDDTGIQIATMDEITGGIRARLLARISTELDVSEESPLGETIDAFGSQARQILELVQAAYAARDPSQASGDALRGLAAITGTIASSPTKTYVPCTITIDTGTYAPGALIANVASDPSKRFVNRDTVTSAAPASVLTGQVFIAETAGPTVVNVGTLTAIAQAVTGWASITNTAGTGQTGAFLGSDAEGTTALRLRREDELARRGSTNVDAIRTDLLDVPNVISATVLMNVSDVTDGNGLPPHSVAAYVRGGTDAAVAAALFGSVAAGIKTYGSTTVNVSDSQGYVWPIGLTRPAELDVYITVTLTAQTGQYVGDTAVKTALAAYGDATLGVGKDVIWSRISAIVQGLGGVIDVLDLRMGLTPSPVGNVNVIVTVAQFADLDISRIVVNSTLVAGAP